MGAGKEDAASAAAAAAMAKITTKGPNKQKYIYRIYIFRGVASFVGFAMLAVGSYLSVKPVGRWGEECGIIGPHWHFTFRPTVVAKEQVSRIE